MIMSESVYRWIYQDWEYQSLLQTSALKLAVI